MQHPSPLCGFFTRVTDRLSGSVMDWFEGLIGSAGTVTTLDTIEGGGLR
jgi:hypothetical protein